MPRFEITDLEDPRLEPFREMRNRNWTEASGLFIAEGPMLVEALVGSSYDVQSILLDRKYQAHYESMVPESVDLLLVDHTCIAGIVGFNFHRGVLGCGRRKPQRNVRADLNRPLDRHETLVATVGVQDPENLGGILRSCAGLGVERVIIGPGTADPLSRRVLRVSMGTLLRLQIFRSRDMLADLAWCTEVLGIETIATSLQGNSEPLESACRSGPILLLVGNERHGLPPDIQAAAKRRVHIDMDLGVDSLNVSVATAISLHYFCRIARDTDPA